MIDIIKSKIRTIPNWPKQGIMFRDTISLLSDPKGLNAMVRMLYDRYNNKDIDVVVGIEARGFITGAILAEKLGVGFIAIRKAGKLPPETISIEYDLEYGTDKMEITKDVIAKNSNVLLVDDLIATGGTCLAACDLIKKIGCNVVECSFIVDLPDLGGKKKLEAAGYKTFTLVEFEGE